MTVLQITVEPQARLDEVVATGKDMYTVKTTKPAKEGKANGHMIKLLAHFFNVSPSKLIISKGERWNEKTVLLMD
jgi:uncharacterized protein (TIGR00251 family)